ncbi:PAS fold family [Coleofasciculus chthonoplastes PCC 7420]|uniref:Circadian input-output histidine kinase CikA n=1 Tax=Coleofasciculus chthonoplastes PCC 7420 TaxID=118168 RepID=B4VXY3_9CYAN|nr:PAS domain S-box protein [Coleofasciculus chthonoplastes]EDX73204.1 PAS fold family [Coleofasciculus chthonoplastes PCC 7420]
MLHPAQSLKSFLANVAGNLPLRTVIIVPFVLQIVGTVGLVGYLSYRNGQKTVDNLAYQLIDEVDERVEQNVSHYLESPHQVTQTLAAAIRTGVIDWKNFPGLERYFAQQLQIYGTVSSMAIVTEEREFLNVAKLLESDSLVIRVLDQSTNYAFHYYTANLQGQRIKRTHVRYDFDPHNDPPQGDSWYQATKQAGKGIWHPLVSLSQGVDQPLLLIANFLPFNDSEGTFQGILTATFFVPELAEFLEGMEVGKTGQVFIINRKGDLVASSTGEIPFKPDLDADYRKNKNLQDWRLPVQQSRNPLTKAAVNFLLTQVKHQSEIKQDQTFKFTFNDNRYFLHINPIQEQSGLNWFIVTVVPESEFMAEIYANTRTTIALCIAALILSILLGISTARWVTKPILQLNIAADEIARGEWQQSIPINRGDEVGQLANSFNIMAAQLRQFFTQLQASNKALSQSEHNLTQILEAIPVGISVHDVTGQLTYANQKSKELLEIETLPDAKIEDLAITYQIYQSDTQQLYPVENLPAVRALNREQTIVDDLEIHQRNQIIPVEAYGTPLLDKNATILGAIVAFFDITERKQAEALQRNYHRILEANVAQRTAELRDANERLKGEMAERQLLEGKLYSSEQQIRTIFEAINDIVLMIDAEKNINVAPTKRTYLSPEDSHLLNLIVEQFFQDPEDSWFAQVQQVLDSQEPLYFDYNLTLDNHEMWLTISIAPLSDQAVIWVARDISDRKQVEDALRTSEYLYRAMARNFPNGAMFLFDPNLRYLVADGQALTEAGHRGEALLGKTLWEVLPPENCALVEPLYHAALAGVEQTQEISFGDFTYLCQSTAVRNNAGTIIAGMVVTQNITERKQFEQALIRSENRFQEIAKTVSQFFFVRSANSGEFLYVSPAYETIWGRSCESLYQHPESWIEAVHPEDRPLVLNSLNQQFQGHSVKREYRIIQPNGEQRWIIADVSVVRNEAGEPLRFVGVAEDITERKQAELELQSIKERLQYLLTASPAVIFSSQIEGDYSATFMSENASTILGYNAEKFIHNAQFWCERVHPEDKAVMNEVIPQLFAQGHCTYEYRFQHGDGTYHWLTTQLRLVQDETGTPIECVGYLIDITERKQAEESLREQEEEYRRIVETADEGIWSIDMNGNTIFVNPKMAQMLGCSVEQMLGQPMFAFMDEAGKAMATRNLERRRQGIHEKHEFKFRRNDGSDLWTLIATTPICDTSGQCTGTLGMITDITDRKRAEDALRYSEQLYRTMAKNFPNGAIFLFDHELRYLVADGQGLGRSGSGYSRNILEGQTIWEVLSEQECAVVETLYREALAGIEKTLEMPYRNRIQLVQTRAVRDEAGEIIAGMVVAQDITERKQTEEALRESEAFLRSIYEGIEAAVFIVDVLENGEFRYVSINPTHERMSGLRNSEIKGKTLHEVLTPDIAEAVCQRYRRCLAAGEKITYEHSLQINGKDSWWISNLTPLKDSNSRIYRLIGTALNISDRKQIELQLKENQRFIEKIINASPQLLYLFDPTAETDLYINRQSLDILGYTPAEIVGRGMQFFLDTLHPDDLPLIERNLNFWHTASDSDILTTESRFRHKDGSWCWLLSREVVFERDENNQVIKILGTSQDITELKEAEDALRRYERIVSSTTDAISLVDRDYTYQIVNQAYLDWNQKHYDEIVGHSVSNLLGEEVFVQVIKPNLDRCLAGETINYQEWFDYPGGKQEFISVTYIPYVDANQQISGVVVNCRNLTELKQVETQLRQTNQEMQAIFDAFPDILFRLAADGTILDFRTKNYQALYTSPDSFVNHKIQEVFPTDAGEKLYAAIQQVLTTKSLVSVEYSLPLNQEEQYFEARMVPLNQNEVIALTRNISDRKQAELALAASQARFAGILEIAKDGIISVDSEQRIILFNQGAEQMFGYKADQILGQSLDLLLPPRAATIHRQHVTNFAQYAGKARQMGERNELFGRRRNGTEFPMEASISKLDINGEIICTAILRDISDRKQAELALSQQKEILQTIFDSIPILLCFYKEGVEVEFINPALEQTLGWSLAEMRDIDIMAEIYPDPDYRTSVLDFMLKADGTWQDFQTQTRRGEVLEITWANIRLPDGSTVGIGKDITERKQAELAIQEREYQLRTLADNLPNGLIYQLVREPNGQFYFSYITAGIERLVGIKPEVIIQDASVLFNLIVDEDRQLNYQLNEESWRNLSIYEMQMRKRTPSGDIRWSYVRSAPRRLVDGRTVWDGIEIDITELKKTEIELAQAKDAAEAANRAKSAFLASMSHELRTPLNGILGYAQILKTNSNLTQKQKDGIEIIHQCGEHLLTLINDILDLSKVEAGKLELYPEDFHFPSFLVGLCEIFRLKAIQKDITFNYNPPTHIPQIVHGDEKRLRQILMNLLSNAVKFTDTGTVTFTVNIIHKGQMTNDKIRFQVEDTGIGMSAEDLEKIFLPFEQIKETSRHHEGTGLGLAITKKLIALMGSQIRVESHPGVGSKFWFEVDLPEVSSSAKFIPAKPLDTIVGYTGAKRKILIVDDRWENCAVLRSVLEPIGFEIQEAENGQEGLENAREWQPDLILVDIVMPVMDGHQMTQELRQISEFNTTPIIAISANAFATNRVESLEAGCTDFITKPIATEELLQKVQVYLNMSWIYEDKAEPSNSYLESGDRVIPTQEELRLLYEAASLGDVAGVEEETMRLQDINPDYIPFALEVLGMAAQFDYDKIVDLLDNCFGD